MLIIILRILAGTSYLDMIHYHFHIDSASKICKDRSITLILMSPEVDQVNCRSQLLAV